jgi:hypothetical protein
MRQYVFINEDGTVHNILNLTGPEAITENDDLKNLLHFDYTEWDEEDKPAPSWTYDRETETWNKVLPFVSNLNIDHLIPVEDSVEDELAGGNE